MDYPINATFRYGNIVLRVFPTKNLNRPCDGCIFKVEKVCISPCELICFAPNRIFRQASSPQPKKHTWRRNLQAAMIWHSRFMSRPENRQLIVMKTMLNEQLIN